MTVWIHSRKGRIEGEVVRQDDTWMHIRLTGEHAPHYLSEANRGRTHDDGEELTLRRSLMREVGCAPSGCQCDCHSPGMTVSHIVACCDGKGQP